MAKILSRIFCLFGFHKGNGVTRYLKFPFSGLEEQCERCEKFKIVKFQ